MRKTAMIVAGLAATALVLGGTSAASADNDSKTLAPQVKALLQAELVPNPMVRVGGADRYETAVAVSQLAWTADTTGAVFLATGENYPDALSISASTGFSGPVLLTRPNELPAITAGELERLAPCVIVVVGGTNAVSEAVAAQAMSYADPEACA